MGKKKAHERCSSDEEPQDDCLQPCKSKKKRREEKAGAVRRLKHWSAHLQACAAERYNKRKEMALNNPKLMHQANIMKEVSPIASAKYQADKRAGTLNGRTYQNYVSMELKNRSI